MEKTELKAYAKINLALDVTGRRDDGYHLVKMVMQTVDIADDISFEKTDDGEITITTDSGELATDKSNLIYKACELLMSDFSVKGGIRVKLSKHIPIAAGMAGGSTDAAAALKAVNMLYELKLDDERLKEYGLRIGADVPYCIMGGTVLAEGIGEKLTKQKNVPEAVVLVAKPDINVSTKYVYEHLDALSDYPHPDVEAVINAINEGSLEGIALNMGNVLEQVTIPRHPVVQDIKDIMKGDGAIGSMMSGSGPSVFGLFEDADAAKAAAEKIRNENLAKQVFVTGFVNM
ncbi:MAG: 4-(cytidine 5'-diphospho)-2-C-methyl-D-erythritol kinase [Lachnospiraceae bacterium]|nr:4-(cytidine 5'-diphospho)-2-C-methyl-D-erythritol kinase [Lachnospiraceae bacterium]